MPDHTPLTDQQLTPDREQEIRTLDLAPLMDDRSAAVISGHLAALLGEIDRLRAERDQFCNRVDTLTSVAKGNKRHVQDMFADLQKAHARIAELERPAVEAERNSLRQSFTELIAQAEQDRDYEGAFDVQCRLREREEQWAREDAAAVPAAVETGE